MIRHKVTFAAGFALGYTLGAKAGRERYDQIMRMVRGAAENPAVQEAAGVLQAQASGIVDSAKRTVSDKVAQTVGGRTVTPDPAPYPSTTPQL